MSVSEGVLLRKQGGEICDKAASAIGLQGAQSESLEVVWKARGGDLRGRLGAGTGTGALAMASRCELSMLSWYNKRQRGRRTRFRRSWGAGEAQRSWGLFVEMRDSETTSTEAKLCRVRTRLVRALLFLVKDAMALLFLVKDVPHAPSCPRPSMTPERLPARRFGFQRIPSLQIPLFARLSFSFLLAYFFELSLFHMFLFLCSCILVPCSCILILLPRPPQLFYSTLT